MADKEAAKKAKKDGLDAFKAKDFDKAIEQYTKAIELDPKDVGYIILNKFVNILIKYHICPGGFCI